ncbi:protein kinase, putative [Trypanosoma vivax Y486]|uniref:Protein kinase, putative n=1 Tax=Trypanosoma vivax (strain Y486) TaxID=1055687 RepID=F9WVZ6_TRYVY|nr:protein kinase, putative [Trypanosoma vivax Y486]|eukprot:CCD21761.1 protein kinase, putative [Trypanosoma vivax Y486]
MRFDDEINKHIGPFCFSLTEWPDGWEQQDIKVVNRPVPPKAPPLHLDGRICVSDDGLESSGKGQVSASAKSATSKQGDGAGNKGGFDMEAVFGLGTDLSPNDQQTGTHGKTHLQEQGGLLDGVAKPSQSANDAGAEKTAKADILDDLFVSTPAEPPKPSAQEAPKPNTAQSLVSDSNWRGSLFNAPQPTPPQMHADAASGLWGSGMPAAPGAGIPGGTAFGAPFAPPQQPQFPQTWYGAPAPGFGGMASQPQMQPAAPMNMTTFPAANFPPQTASMPMPKKEEKKDPFADLFA